MGQQLELLYNIMTSTSSPTDEITISEDEHSHWLTPAEALERLGHLTNYEAAKAIVERLHNGLIRVSAEIIVRTYNGKAERLYFGLVPIKFLRNAWLAIESSFWRTGQIVGLEIHPSEYSLFGLRFDPEGIARLELRPSIKSEAPDSPTTRSPTRELALTRIVPVSEAHLHAWWTFYQVIRAPHEQTEEDAAAHFAQCMPDKSVTRARIRALRGRQKSGPKPRSAK